jgi:hypothetical protein
MVILFLQLIQIRKFINERQPIFYFQQFGRYSTYPDQDLETAKRNMQMSGEESRQRSLIGNGFE